MGTTEVRPVRKRRARQAAWLAGPVVITGASSHVGRFLANRMEQVENEIRPLDRDGDLKVALEGAEAVIHLAGALRPGKASTFARDNLEPVERLLDSLDRASVKRLVFLSHVGADPSSRNHYLRTKGEAEDLIRRSTCEAVILRSSLIYGPREDPGPGVTLFISRTGGRVEVVGTGAQRVAPVYVMDVVAALVHAALDPGAPLGTFALVGPDVLTMDEFVELLYPRPVEEHHHAALLARLRGRVTPAQTRAWVELLSSDSLPDAPRVAEAFGLRPASVGSAYGRLPVLTY